MFFEFNAIRNHEKENLIVGWVIGSNFSFVPNRSEIKKLSRAPSPAKGGISGLNIKKDQSVFQSAGHIDSNIIFPHVWFQIWVGGKGDSNIIFPHVTAVTHSLTSISLTFGRNRDNGRDITKFVIFDFNVLGKVWGISNTRVKRFPPGISVSPGIR